MVFKSLMLSIMSKLFTVESFLALASAAAAVASAVAARQSALISRSLAKFERHYIVYGPDIVLHELQNNAPITKIRMNISNYGKTAGAITNLYWEVVFGDLPGKRTINENSLSKRREHYGVWPAGHSHTYEKDSDSVLIETDQSFHLIGHIDYTELNGKTHRSNFAAQIIPQKRTWEGGVGGKEWNDFD